MDIFNAHQEFIFDCEMRKLSDKTLKGYRNNPIIFFRFIQEQFNVVNLEDVTPKQIKEFLRKLSSNGRKSSYINGHLKILKSFFGYCYSEEYISYNPTNKVPYAREGQVLM